MQDTSISAYRSMPVKKLATQADRICDLVKLHFIAWGGNLSLREIKSLYQSRYSEIDLSTIAARVNALVAAKRLRRLEETRKCRLSGIHVHPLVPGDAA
jgi:hypothetical protein